MKVKLDKVDLWLSCDEKKLLYNKITFKTEGGAKIEFPVNMDFFIKLEKMIFTEMGSDIKEQCSIAINGQDNQKEFYLLSL